MVVRTPYEEDLFSANPVVQLYQHVKDDVQSGRVQREEVIAELRRLYRQMKAEGLEPEQDAIADVIDALTDYCAPGLAI